MSLGSQEEENRSAWPHGESKERSRRVTERKHRGIMKRSRALPRRVRETRVVLSNWRNLRHVKDREFRVRVSEIKAKALIRIASGRSFMVVMSLVVEAFGFGRGRVSFYRLLWLL